MKAMEIRNNTSTPRPSSAYHVDLENVKIFSCWAGLATAVLSLMVFIEKGWLVFILHPILMIVAWVFCATEGILSYKSIPTWNPRVPHRKTQRERHRVMQIACLMTTVLGTMAIVYNKLVIGKSPSPQSVHAWIGSLTIVLCLVQAILGQLKLDRLHLNGIRIFRWHGTVGKVIYALACLTVVLGLPQVLKGPGLAVGYVLVGSVVSCLSYALMVGQSGSGSGSGIP